MVDNLTWSTWIFNQPTLPGWPKLPSPVEVDKVDPKVGPVEPSKGCFSGGWCPSSFWSKKSPLFFRTKIRMHTFRTATKNGHIQCSAVRFDFVGCLHPEGDIYKRPSPQNPAKTKLVVGSYQKIPRKGKKGSNVENSNVNPSPPKKCTYYRPSQFVCWHDRISSPDRDDHLDITIHENHKTTSPCTSVSPSVYSPSPGSHLHGNSHLHPRKLTGNPKIEGLEDVSSFSKGWFSSFMFVFWKVYLEKKTCKEHFNIEGIVSYRSPKWTLSSGKIKTPKVSNM